MTLSPLECEWMQGAEECIAFPTFSMKVFGTKLVNVVTFIRNNCNLNRSISTKTEICCWAEPALSFWL